MPKFTIALLLALGGVALLGAAAVFASAPAAQPKLTPRAYAPAISKAALPPTPTPTPTPVPQVNHGDVAGITLSSAFINNNMPIDQRDTEFKGGSEFLQEPRSPGAIAWYPRFGRPGARAGNTIFAAHVNYVNYGRTPFSHLTAALPDDALYITMADGYVFTYTVRSVEIIDINDLNMDLVVFPPLDSYTERVTLISCGGTFVPNPNGYGGHYNSRVILIAERYVP
jgi:hypothetical protein